MEEGNPADGVESQESEIIEDAPSSSSLPAEQETFHVESQSTVPAEQDTLWDDVSEISSFGSSFSSSPQRVDDPSLN